MATKKKSSSSYLDLRVGKVCLGLVNRGVDPDIAIEEVLSGMQYSDAMKSHFKEVLKREIEKVNGME